MYARAAARNPRQNPGNFKIARAPAKELRGSLQAVSVEEAVRVRRMATQQLLVPQIACVDRQDPKWAA